MRRRLIVLGVLFFVLAGCGRHEAIPEKGVTERVVSGMAVEPSENSQETDRKSEEMRAAETEPEEEAITKEETGIKETKEEAAQRRQAAKPEEKEKQGAEEKSGAKEKPEEKANEGVTVKKEESGRGGLSSSSESKAAGQTAVPADSAALGEENLQKDEAVSVSEDKKPAPAPAPTSNAEYTTVHTHRIVTETKAPTCTAAGEIKTYCADCKEVQSVTAGAAATGHRMIESWFGDKPTCHMRGYLTIRCELCGYIESSGSVPELEHVRDGGTIICQGNCTAKTVKVYKCTLCGTDMGYEEWYEPDVHDWAEGEGEDWNEELQKVETVRFIYCTRCGKRA